MRFSKSWLLGSLAIALLINTGCSNSTRPISLPDPIPTPSLNLPTTPETSSNAPVNPGLDPHSTSHPEYTTPEFAPTPIQSSSSQIPVPPSGLTTEIEAEPIYGVWKLEYSVLGTLYQSSLEMNGSTGIMLTIFLDPLTHYSHTVEQQMRVVPNAQGLLIVGERVVYPGTNIPYPSYNPDSFLFQSTPHGESFITCDTANVCSPVDIVTMTLW